MQYISRGRTKGMINMWKVVQLLLLAFYVTFTAGQDCVVSQNGIVVPNWDFEFVNRVQDDADAGTTIGVLTYENVNDVQLLVNAEETIYVTIDNIVSENTINIKIADNFVDFETNEGAVQLSFILAFTCASGSIRNMGIYSDIDFTNNNVPVFENYNNEEKDAYIFTLPIPFPKGVSITAAYSAILAFDKDISTTDVTFELDDPSDSFEVLQGIKQGPDENGKFKYSADLRAKTRFESTIPVDLKIKALDVGGGIGPQQVSEASIRIEIDKENSEPFESSSFISSLYTVNVEDTTVPPGPLVPHEEIKFLNPPVGPITVTVVQSPGTASFYPGLFSAAYDEVTQVVTLSRVQDFTPEQLDNEALIVTLKASQTDNAIFQPETIVHVNLPAKILPPEGQFSSNLYLAAIDFPNMDPEELPTTEEIILLNPPAGTIEVGLERPYAGAPWVDGQFAVTYADGKVTLNLAASLDPSLLTLEFINLLLKATEATTNFEVTSVIQVDLPVAAETPVSKFASLLYTSQVTDENTSADLETNPTPIQIENVPDGVIEVKLEEITGEIFVPDQFSVEYAAGGLVTLKFVAPLKPLAMDLEYIQMLLKASNADGFEATTVVVVDLPQKVAPGSSGLFNSPFYTTTIQDPLLAAGTTLDTIPTPITILNTPDDDIKVELLKLEGEEFVTDQFSVEYQAGGTVILKLKTELTPEALLLESVRMLLKATKGDGSFEASTVVHVDLPPTTIPQVISSFTSPLYTSAIATIGTVPGNLETNPTPISILNFPDGEVIVELKPLEEEPFVAGLFGVEYITGTGGVTLKLLKELTAEALQYEVLHLVLKASKTDVNFEATTVISVDIPQIVPTESTKFESQIYTAIINNHEMVPGDLLTNPDKILIQNAPDDVVAVALQKIVGENFVKDQFNVVYAGNGEVLLQLSAPLTAETLALESMTMLLLATHESFAISTVISIDIPEVPEASQPGKFDNVLHTTVISGSEVAPAALPTNPKIMITNPPADFDLTLSKPPGVDNSYETYFSAARVDQTGEITLSLAKALDDDPLNNEVIVLLLRAENGDGYISETLIQVDMPSLIPVPPGDPGTFTSVIYITEINDPEFAGDLTTSIPITLTGAPDDVVPTLQAVEGVNSYVEKFAVQKAAGEVLTVTLSEKLPAEVFEDNTVLVMTIVATSPSDPEFKGETVLYVKLPAHTCPEEPPLTTCQPCNECPPCEYTTLPPPSTITFSEPVYTSENMDAGYTGDLFTVKAFYNGVEAVFEYGIDTDGNTLLLESLYIDSVTGEVTIGDALVPGKYRFFVTAKYETGEKASAPAVINILSTAPCTEGLCFPYALMTMTVPEGQEQVLIEGATNPTCKYYKIETLPNKADAWFNYNVDTGELTISKDSDIEDVIFNILDAPQIQLKLELECDVTPSKSSLDTHLYQRASITVTRSQMLVVVTLENINDNWPKFPVSSMIVAYPNKELARQLLPGAIVQLKATDADREDTLTYDLKRINDKVEINTKTGSLYPVEGTYNYVDTTATIAAYDSSNHDAEIEVEIRHVDDSQIAALFVSGKVLEDTDQILTIINDQLDNTWSVLQSAVLADREVESSLFDLIRTRRNVARAGETGGLVLVLCAIPDEGTPLGYQTLKSELESLDLTGLTWSISGIETWSDVIGINDGGSGGGTEGDTDGLTAAVIVLGCLTGLFAIALIVLVYITVFRKRQQKKNKAKAGFKNRTSFSGGPVHRDSVAVQKAHKQNLQNGLHPDWTSEEDKHDYDQEERRKSMVTFSDETEVIPTEVARL